MAFSSSTFLPQSAQANSNASRAFSYNTGDNTATVGGANYFDSAADPAGVLGLKTYDYIFCSHRDGSDIYQLSVSAGVVTLAVSVAFS